MSRRSEPQHFSEISVMRLLGAPLPRFEGSDTETGHPQVWAGMLLRTRISGWDLTGNASTAKRNECALECWKVRIAAHFHPVSVARFLFSFQAKVAKSRVRWLGLCLTSIFGP